MKEEIKDIASPERKLVSYRFFLCRKYISAIIIYNKKANKIRNITIRMLKALFGNVSNFNLEFLAIDEMEINLPISFSYI